MLSLLNQTARLVAGVACLLALSVHAQSGAIDNAVLRVNAEGHIAPIRAIDLDASQRFLVTAGDDKTVRVWDVSKGELLSVLRPPIGARNEGALNSVAISPDGQFVATGGWSTGNDVFVFDRLSGQLVHRLTGLGNVITRLAFSKNQQLAIGVFGNAPLVVARSKDGWKTAQIVRSGDESLGTINGLAWHPSRQDIVVAGSAGTVALFSITDGAVVTKAQTRVGATFVPYRVVFSPDGQRVAVGDQEKAQLAILSGDSLRVQQQLGPTAPRLGTTGLVVWDANSAAITAMGTYRNHVGAIAVRGQTTATTFSEMPSVISVDSLTDAVGTGDGGAIVASATGQWIRIDPQGRIVQQTQTAAFDFRPKSAAWRVSSDATAFDFSGKGFFSLENGWTQKAASATVMIAPSTTRANLRLTDTFESREPKLNGRRLSMDENELALSAAVHPAGDGAALGSQWAMRRFSKEGALVWKQEFASPIWQVAWSGDARWIILASGDGTIRWLRAQDGVEQLSAFLHADGKRWVAWTPSGYFATSPGGEDLFGWHLPRGDDRAADFFPGSRLRTPFFRPDVVSALLSSGNEALALNQANAARMSAQQIDTPKPVGAESRPSLPPVIEIDGVAAPPVAGQPISLKLSVRSSPSAPVIALKMRQDGALVDVPALNRLPTPRTQANEFTYGLSLTVESPVGAQQLAFFAENAAGSSRPAIITLTPAKAPSPATSSAPPAVVKQDPISAPALDLRPTLYVLSVGVAQYKDKNLALDFSAKDARDFATALGGQRGRLYRHVEVKLLTDREATRDAVLDGLEWIRRAMTSRDVGMVFLAGHGVNDADDTYYFLPYDAEVDRLKRSAVIFTEIKNTLAALPGKAMFFVDTCHSGNVLGSTRKTRSSASARDLTRAVNELASAENGVIVFAASTGKQLAQEASDWKNGAFTLALVEGLSGRADFARSGRITHKMLDLYVSERVKKLTDGAQSPVTIVPQGVPDFPVAVSAN